MSEDLLLYAQLGYADHISRLVAEGTDPGLAPRGRRHHADDRGAHRPPRDHGGA